MIAKFENIQYLLKSFNTAKIRNSSETNHHIIESIVIIKEALKKITASATIAQESLSKSEIIHDDIEGMIKNEHENLSTVYVEPKAWLSYFTTCRWIYTHIYFLEILFS